MAEIPAWLTPIITIESFDGDPEKYIENIFSIFKRDFIDTAPFLHDKVIFFDRKDDNGRPAAFLHITTEEDKATGCRNISLRRCERIEWVRAIIEHIDDPAVLYWKKEQYTARRWATRTYLFLEQENFLVVLEEMTNGNLLITAIYVDLPHQKRKHLRDCEAYKKANP